jgi:pheromone shutdown protein TraB
MDPMIATHNKLEDEYINFLRETMPIRDRHMAGKIRSLRINDGPNFVVVGAAHLKGLRELLNDIACIFMVPKHVVAEFPHASLKEGPLNRGSVSL